MIEVESIMNEFLADFETGGDAVLKQYADRYPDLIEELYERAGLARMFNFMPEVEMTPEKEVSLNLRASSIVQNLLYEAGATATSQADAAKVEEKAELENLTGRIVEVGESFETIGKKTRLSTHIVRKLNKRQITPETIPKRLFQLFAELLSLPFEVIERFSTGPPVISSGSYKADSAPKFPAQSDFADLIKYDPDLSDEDKEYWLSIPPASEM